MTDPQVVNRPAFSVLGVVRHFESPESADFEGTWQAFGPQQALIEPGRELLYRVPANMGGGADHVRA
jgi:hypothetical protein